MCWYHDDKQVARDQMFLRKIKQGFLFRLLQKWNVLPVPTVRIVSKDSTVNSIFSAKDFLDDDVDDDSVSFILFAMGLSFCGSSIRFWSTILSESIWGIFDIVEFALDIIEVRLMGGNSPIVVEAILVVKSSLSDVVVIFANESRRTGRTVDVPELFFEDIRDDFRRFTVVTAIGVVFERVTFFCERGIYEVDPRVNRRVNKRSECFVGLIERTVAMLEIWSRNRMSLKNFINRNAKKNIEDLRKERTSNDYDSKWHLNFFFWINIT